MRDDKELTKHEVELLVAVQEIHYYTTDSDGEATEWHHQGNYLEDTEYYICNNCREIFYDWEEANKHKEEYDIGHKQRRRR